MMSDRRRQILAIQNKLLEARSDTMALLLKDLDPAQIDLLIRGTYHTLEAVHYLTEAMKDEQQREAPHHHT
jgi:hypothetical protein